VFIRCQNCGAQLELDARFCGVCGTELVDPNIGRVVARRYTLRERIGAGSLGIVYRAEQLNTGRKLAIKLLPPDASRDLQLAQRFHREGEVLARLRSAHSVTIYEYDHEPDGSLFIAMELSPGTNLAEIVRRDGALPWPRVLRILNGLCESLAEAHALGIVHRDLKPANILIESRGNDHDYVKLTDFGLAKVLVSNVKVSPTGETVGNVEYASPEQLLRRPIDARSDIYSLGVLGFQLVTGQHPFSYARSFGDMVDAHINMPPPIASEVRPGLSPDLDALFARCLEKEPSRRYPDAGTLASMIGVVLAMAPSESSDTLREQVISIGDEDTVLAESPDRSRS
jgi:eukaryotic-like serine/threonine-protein kinase